MFDDGYDHFCFNFVSLFEAGPSNKEMGAGTYCGCVDYLEQKVAAAEAESSDMELTESA
ncbi:MAG: hypothetical protein AAF468_18980 [Pseudomonadota bacterium]